MFTRLKNLFVTRTDDDLLDEAVASAPVVGGSFLRQRHADLIARGQAAGMDPATLLLLLQVFGPLAVKIIEAVLAWVQKRGG